MPKKPVPRKRAWLKAYESKNPEKEGGNSTQGDSTLGNLRKGGRERTESDEKEAGNFQRRKDRCPLQ